MTAFEKYDQPRLKVVVTPNKQALGKTFKRQAKAVQDALEQLQVSLCGCETLSYLTMLLRIAHFVGCGCGSLRINRCQTYDCCHMSASYTSVTAPIPATAAMAATSCNNIFLYVADRLVGLLLWCTSSRYINCS